MGKKGFKKDGGTVAQKAVFPPGLLVCFCAFYRVIQFLLIAAVRIGGDSGRERVFCLKNQGILGCCCHLCPCMGLLSLSAGG